MKCITFRIEATEKYILNLFLLSLSTEMTLYLHIF